MAAGQGGLTAKQMDEDYAAMVGEYSPDILFLAPDLYDADGNLAESDAAAFAGHIRSVAAKAKEAGAKVVLVTPVTVRGGEDEYAGAMRTVAKEDDLPLIDAQAWIGRSSPLTRASRPRGSTRPASSTTPGISATRDS